ncbi:MAG: hypothetical protein WCJ36_02800 [Candidatus Saccharibacteria bacterium]
MSVLVKATQAREPRTRESQTIAYAYGAILVIFVVAQLFTFDKFLPLLASFNLPGGDAAAYLLGGIIVVGEVFALPFLLNMSISPLMRIVSMGLGWLVPFLWFMLAIWLNTNVSGTPSFCFLGTIANLSCGPWAILISVALGILAAWSSYGLWPGHRK